MSEVREGFLIPEDGLGVLVSERSMRQVELLELREHLRREELPDERSREWCVAEPEVLHLGDVLREKDGLDVGERAVAAVIVVTKVEYECLELRPARVGHRLDRCAVEPARDELERLEVRQVDPLTELHLAHLDAQ